MRKWRKRVIFWITLNGGLKIVLSAWVVLLMAFLFTSEWPSTKTWSYWTMPLSGKVIALDPGHGGPDGGASSKNGLVEKDVNLAISLYLRDYLQQAGAVVIMTRETDRDLARTGTKGLSKRKTEDLLKRAEIVTKHKADLLISIHLNSIPSAKWRGAQTFYYPKGHADGELLATHIQNEIKGNLGNTDRVAQTVDTVYLLKTLTIPSALVEVGFLSNPEEARLMGDETYQRKMAASIYQGILRYYSGEKLVTLDYY
ncbi:N-acetylmuramoyl-L-alanine amidase CwlD [Paenibacillus sp. J2TS4]|uniref:N-acetylmuramoyl-L-alanine amidase CwlD n=1 Tax=Paenibacillus sp. J2TS4 TaxID=2807194 RepID=UPI001B1737AF|nr:N-acetylmuramoyl-L-alanine amidase CwlD [Paenibacillus sp. J2TS4]GIP36299.1 germination-specific N-acetylmuramoyl-L-alanine amidase [Paenibacillus sp. J2TS4]